jgi:hypothetical protein
VHEGQDDELDGYMRLKRAWNVKAMECGVPYTIVSQGAFSEWMVETCPFVHHDTCTIDVVGEDPEAVGYASPPPDTRFPPPPHTQPHLPTHKRRRPCSSCTAFLSGLLLHRSAGWGGGSGW